MNAHVLQHEPFEGIGSMEKWFTQKNTNITYTRFFENDSLPKLDSLNLLIVMGGSMSVNDESTLPWLRPEKKFIREAIARGIAVLGICLGAQLIANSMGARVYKNPQKEIGWFPVESTSESPNVFCFPKKFLVFQWHGETFDLPENATHLAKSNACKNQAFQLGKNVLALQFHLEMMQENVESISENCSHELTPAPHIQTFEQMKNISDDVYIQTNKLMGDILAYLTANS